MPQQQRNQRINFGKIGNIADTPDLLAVQIQSFKEFFQLETTPDKRNIEGLFRVFKENFPITDTRNIFVLEFLIILLIRPATPSKSVWSVVLRMLFP
jgi:DNA-directed RNA polymerase subunit beta